MSSGSVSAAFSRGSAGVRRRSQDRDGISWDMGSHQGHEPTPVPCLRLFSHSPVLFPSGKAAPSPWHGPQGCTVHVGSECRQVLHPTPPWPLAWCSQTSARKEPPVNDLINWDIGIS